MKHCSLEFVMNTVEYKDATNLCYQNYCLFNRMVSARGEEAETLASLKYSLCESRKKLDCYLFEIIVSARGGRSGSAPSLRIRSLQEEEGSEVH